MAVTAADPGVGAAGAAAVRSLPIRALDAVRRRPEILTALLCAVILAVGIRGPDLPAQNYRVWLLRHHGLVVFDSHWYAGHTLPGYSLLFPPLAAVIGARLLGALSCVAATAALTRLLRRDRPGGHDLALLWFAVVVTVDLFVGRLPFALGLAFGIGALVAAREDRRIWCAVLAVACAAASPLAGAFLLLAAVAWWPDAGWRRVWPLGLAAIGIAAAAVFGEGGTFPFETFDLVAVVAIGGFAALLLPGDAALVRRGCVLYALAGLVLFAVPNPIGGNVERLGAIMAGPVAAYELLHRDRLRRWLFALGALPMLAWQLAPVPDAIATSYSPSAHSSYYTGLVHYLDAHGARTERIEVPLTRARWETDYLATKFPLARGWERQVDLEHNAVLYRHDLSAAGYYGWLRANAVQWVALPDVGLDGSEAGERRLLTGPTLPFLTPVWQDAHWRLWAVRGPTSLVSGPATLVSLDVSRFTLRATGAGTATVLLRWTKFWRVTAGNACVAPTTDGWTSVTLFGPGDVTVSAVVNPGSLVGSGANGTCSTASG
ncbi:MAG: hypothetical protein QOC82_540 [Frankiaceae bacterium]|nr:hypothetical protein [Frankiaceae bacterium]